MSRFGFLFLLAMLGLRGIFWLVAYPNSDEAYYWLWGQHLQWSYYDHPPLQAWVQSAVTGILGRSNFALRLPNLFSNLAFFYTYYKITSYLYPQQPRQRFWFVVLLVLASPLYFLFLGFAWHDHLLITFSLIAAYQFVRFADGYLANDRGETKRLYWSASAIALAGISKYNAVFVVLGFLATIISVPKLRTLLLDRRLYFAGLIALTALIPIAIWNYSNDFQSFQYYVDRTVHPANNEVKIGACFAFLAASFFLVSPFYWKGFFRVLRNRSQLPEIASIYPVVAFWTFFISTIVLTIISLISAALYYWNITAYLLLFPLLPLVFPKKVPNGPLIYGLVLSTLIMVHYTVVPLSALISKDGDPDSRLLYGWQNVATAVRSAYGEIVKNDRDAKPLILTTDYRSASALAYELNNKNVLAISDRVDQFDFWAGNQLRGKPAVIVWDDEFPATGKLLPKFDRVSAPKTVTIDRWGIPIKTYYVQKGYWYKP